MRSLWFVSLLALAAAPASAQYTPSVENSSRNPHLSPRTYDSWKRTSVYIPVRDGTRLAADIFRPTRGGQLHEEPLPLVWTHDRYQRASVQGGRVVTKVGRRAMLSELLRRGYVVADVDVRGGGASFGHWTGVFSKVETADADDVIDWFAGQPWCDGNIGMYGGSYLGATQYMAASNGNQHLKAIVPNVAPIDLYGFAWMGGIYRDNFVNSWHLLTKRLDTNGSVAPVDEDVDRSLLKAAIAEHVAGNWNTREAFALPYREAEHRGLRPYLDGSPIYQAEAISASGVAVYHLGGWFDCFTRDAFVMFNNLDNPQRLIMSPTFHQGAGPADRTGEHLQWYDYWLKGIDNGVMDQPPIHYYVMGSPEGQGWRSAWEWPLPEEERTRFFFHGSEEAGRGGLSTASPPGGVDGYTVDYSATSGKSNRWTNGYGGPMGYSDMAPNDARGLTYTTAPLAEDVEVTGHPVATLWVASTAGDGDFYVYLEEVDGDGVSTYVTEGCLRASHRAVQDPPFYYLDLPYHSGHEADRVPGFQGQDPVKLLIDLLPTSNLFDEGNRIRVTITCADADNADNPEVSPPPTVTLHRGGAHASSIVLPVIPVEE